MQWFRFYGEAISDPKVRRIVRATKLPTATVVGVWAIVLSIASDSPERGKLLLGTSPATEDDIADMAGMEVAPVMAEMLKVGMLGGGPEGFFIPNWDKRQFASDTSTTRVRQWRDKNKGKEEETENGNGAKRFGNVSGNDDETDQNRTEQNRPEVVPPPPPVKAKTAADAVVQAMVDPKYKEFVAIMDKHWGPRVISSATADDIAGWAKITPVEEWEYAVEQGRKHGKTNLRYVETILERVQRDGIPEGQGPVNAKEKGTEKVSGVVKGFKLSQVGM
jgi:hypothetical protein